MYPKKVSNFVLAKTIPSPQTNRKSLNFTRINLSSNRLSNNVLKTRNQTLSDIQLEDKINTSLNKKRCSCKKNELHAILPQRLKYNKNINTGWRYNNKRLCEKIVEKKTRLNLLHLGICRKNITWRHKFFPILI